MWILFTGEIMILLRFLTQLIQLKELKTQSGLREPNNFARSISDRVELFPVLRLERYNKSRVKLRKIYTVFEIGVRKIFMRRY